MRSGWQSCRSTAVHNPQAFPSPTISLAGTVEEASGALDGKIVSSEPTGTLIGHSAFLCVGGKSRGNFLHYTTIFLICISAAKKIHGPIRARSVDKVLDARGQCRSHDRRLRSALVRRP